MEDSTFDVLLRQAAQQTTRREALGALIGGALLLNEPDVSEATQVAERRQHDNHHDRHAHRKTVVYRSIGIDIDNAASTRPVIVNHGQAGTAKCCQYRFDGTVAAGERRTFNANTTTGWVQINNRFWFQFTNPSFSRPFARVAVYGKYSGRNALCCNVIPNGLTIVEDARFDVNQTYPWELGESQALFSVTRLQNTSHLIRFAITLPPDLPNGPS
jgi:hypothetical protein